MKMNKNRVDYHEAKAHMNGKRKVLASVETNAGGRIPYRIIRLIFDDMTVLDFLFGTDLGESRGFELTTYTD